MGKLKEYKQEIIKKYLDGINTVELSKEYNCYPSAINYILKSNNIKLRSLSECNRKYTIDEHYFDIIDNEQKAYILGLLYADGYNNESKHEVVLTLKESDKKILEDINENISSNKPLRYIKLNDEKRSNCYRLIIENKYLSEKLSELGVIQRKTFNISFPKWLDKNLYNHFIRGYFDGDGCICIGKNPTFSIVGTYEFLIEVQDVLIKECGLNKTKFGKRREETDIFTLLYCGRNNVKKIRDWMYLDARMYIERKFDKFYLI